MAILATPALPALTQKLTPDRMEKLCILPTGAEFRRCEALISETSALGPVWLLQEIEISPTLRADHLVDRSDAAPSNLSPYERLDHLANAERMVRMRPKERIRSNGTLSDAVLLF